MDTYTILENSANNPNLDIRTPISSSDSVISMASTTITTTTFSNMTRNTETKTIDDEHNLSRKEKEKLEEIAKENELFQKMEDVNAENNKAYQALKSLVPYMKYIHPIAMHELNIV